MLLRDDQVHREYHRGDGIDREGGAYGIYGDILEGLFQVCQRVDSHSQASHLSGGTRVVRVETELGRQVECHVQAGLSVLQQVFEALVRLPGRAEARVLAHGPGTFSVHKGMDSPREGELARYPDVAPVVDLRHVIGSIEGLHGDSGLESHLPQFLIMAFHGQPLPFIADQRLASRR